MTHFHAAWTASCEAAPWTAVLGNLRSVTFYARARLATLPTLFMAAGHLRRASISVAALGTAEQPAVLGGGIASASNLSLRAESLHVAIPSGVTWSSISWHDIGELGIRQVHTC